MFSFVSERKTCQVFPVHTSKFSKVEVCDTGMRDSDICYTGMRDCTGHSIHGSDTRVLATEMLDTVETSCDPHGYLRIKVQSQGLNQWNDCVDRDGFLIAEKVHQHFHSMFDLHFENSDLTAMSNCLHKMRDYRERPELGVTVDMSKTKPGSKLHFLWRGCQFKRLIVEVDLIPAVEILGWPQTAIVSPQEGCSLYHVIPKVSPSLQNNPSAGLYWRISTSLAEKSLFKTMSAPALACYTICKLLMHSSNPVQLFSHSMDFASQDINSCWLFFTV